VELDYDMSSLSPAERERLREILRGLVKRKTQDVVAGELGISQSTLSNYLNQQKQQQPRYSLDKIADSLGIYPEELLARIKGRPLPKNVDDLTLAELQNLRSQIEQRIDKILQP